MQTQLATEYNFENVCDAASVVLKYNHNTTETYFMKANADMTLVQCIILLLSLHMPPTHYII